MIVDCGVYRHGAREGRVELEEAGAAASRGDGFAWIGLHDPSMAELEVVAQQFKLHELLVEDVCKAHQRAKFEHYDEVDFIVLKSVRYEPDEVAIDEIQVLLGHDFIVTVRHGAAPPLGPVRTRMEANPELTARGPAAVLYAVADQLVDQYAPVVAELELDVDQAEEAVFSDARDNPGERIFGLKRQVLELLRNLVPMEQVLERLQRPDATVADDDLDNYFRDVADHLHRTLSQAEVLRDLLTDALNANLAQVSVRQNEDMRTISGWAALIAAPTLLAGIWGMNFRHMPELDWTLGYPLALGSMVAVVLLLFRRFRRSGWL